MPPMLDELIADLKDANTNMLLEYQILAAGPEKALIHIRTNRPKDKIELLVEHLQLKYAISCITVEPDSLGLCNIKGLYQLTACEQERISINQGNGVIRVNNPFIRISTD